MRSQTRAESQAVSKGASLRHSLQFSDVGTMQVNGKPERKSTQKVDAERLKLVESVSRSATALTEQRQSARRVTFTAQASDLLQNAFRENDLLESQNELLATQADIARLHGVVKHQNLQISELNSTVGSQRAQIRLLQQKCGCFGELEAARQLSQNYTALFDSNYAELPERQHRSQPTTSALQSELLQHEIDLYRAKQRVLALETENASLKQQVESSNDSLARRAIENEAFQTIKQKYDRLFVQHKVAYKQLRYEADAAALARQQLESIKMALAETKTELANAKALAESSLSAEVARVTQTAEENSRLKELNRQLALYNAGLLEQLSTLYARKHREIECYGEMERLKARCHDLIKDKLNLTARVEFLSQTVEHPGI